MNEKQPSGFIFGFILLIFAFVALIIDLIAFKADYVITPIYFFLYGLYIYRKQQFALGRPQGSSYKLIEGSSAKKLGAHLLIGALVTTILYYGFIFVENVSTDGRYELHMGITMVLILTLVFHAHLRKGSILSHE